MLPKGELNYERDGRVRQPLKPRGRVGLYYARIPQAGEPVIRAADLIEHGVVHGGRPADAAGPNKINGF